LKRIIFATGNKNKLRELREILPDFAGEVITMKEAGFTGDIDENGKTFSENAMIKASSIAAQFPEDIVIADDSGLCIDALGGEPGVYSARYLGEDTPYEKKNSIILERLSAVPFEKRTARFVCAVAVCLPGGEDFTVEGTIEGHIHDRIEGEGGFGYDPIFYVQDAHMTTAQMTPDEKNAISHRGKAMRAMAERLEAYL
jgi:XTP/dITP diphosphohydrolase